MKTLVFFAVLAASTVLAANAVSVEPEPPSEYNAHWRIIPGAGVGCVRDDLFIYGCNDSAGMIYAGETINLAGYDGVTIRICYSLETADEGDYAEFYLKDGPDDYSLLCRLEGRTDGTTCYVTTINDYYGCSNLGMRIDWTSNQIGVARGIRIYYIMLEGVNWGEGEYHNIFTWNATDMVTGRQSLDAPMSPGFFHCLAFEYGTDVGSQGWWAIDSVDLTADGESILPRQGGGLGVEDFSSGGWYQDRHGQSGGWEIDTDHAMGDISGANWQCDSAANPGSLYEAETLSPWIQFPHAGTEVGVEFNTWWNPVGADEYASLGFYTANGVPLFEDVFNDLRDWEIVDYGDEVTETSWGAIKASF
jgi:hypothetical protein